MNTAFTITVQGEIRFPDIALLAQAMLGQSAPTPVPAPVPSASDPTNHPAPPVATPATEAPKYSIDDIARAGAELAQQGPDKIPALTGLLTQFGLQAVTQLRPEQMGPFVTALRGLGARI